MYMKLESYDYRLILPVPKTKLFAQIMREEFKIQKNSNGYKF
uniref:Uncharacterized protein n=1 Tax=Rhizophora mucronata TaxID=61149 RepID=A0A2P2NFB5_RHIMU